MSKTVKYDPTTARRTIVDDTAGVVIPNRRYVIAGLSNPQAPYYTSMTSALTGATSSTVIEVYPGDYGTITISTPCTIILHEGAKFTSIQIGTGTTFNQQCAHIMGSGTIGTLKVYRAGSSSIANIIEAREITTLFELDYGSYVRAKVKNSGAISTPNAGASVTNIEIETDRSGAITLNNSTFKFFIKGKAGALKLTNAYGYIEADEAGQVTVENGYTANPPEVYDVVVNIRKIYTAMTADGSFGFDVRNSSKVLLRNCRLTVASDVNVALQVASYSKISIRDCTIKAQKTSGYAFAYSSSASFHARDSEFINTVGTAVLVGNSVVNGMFNCAIKAANGYYSFNGSGTAWLYRCVGDRAPSSTVTASGDYYTGMMDGIL